MAFARLLSRLLRSDTIGDLIVPIVPDEARTFGMEALFRQVGIYAHAGQLYEPVDHATLLSYREAEDGQVLEEGITDGIVHCRRHRLCHARHQHDSVFHLLLDVRVSTGGRPDLGGRRLPVPRLSAGRDARRSPAKGCSTRTARATCLPTR